MRNIDNIEKLTNEIAELNKLISSERLLKSHISKQLRDIAKEYGQDRKTGLIETEEIVEYKAEEHIEDYPLTIFFTKGQYLKKVSAASLRFTTSEHKLREDDEIIVTTETTNKSELIFFSDKCNAYKLKTYDVPDCKVTSLGEYLPGILGLEDDEKILYAVVTKTFEGIMLFTFENGKMAKVELKNYETKTNRKKLIGAYSDKSPVCDIKFIEGDTDVVLLAEDNKVLYFNTKLVPLKTTKSTQGVQVIRQPKKGQVKPVRVMLEAECGIDNVKQYVAHSIPQSAKTIKSESAQLSLI